MVWVAIDFNPGAAIGRGKKSIPKDSLRIAVHEKTKHSRREVSFRIDCVLADRLGWKHGDDIMIVKDGLTFGLTTLHNYRRMTMDERPQRTRRLSYNNNTSKSPAGGLKVKFNIEPHLESSIVQSGKPREEVNPFVQNGVLLFKSI
jgi:hypothetical protein